MNMDEKENKQVESLATEMLRELKATSKRWFTAFIVTLLLWFATIIGFIWYISLPVEEYDIDQNAEDNGNNSIIGGDYIGTTESELQEESDTESQT